MFLFVIQQSWLLQNNNNNSNNIKKNQLLIKHAIVDIFNFISYMLLKRLNVILFVIIII